jgi:cytochrome c oxidase accessory protein FixG
VNKIATPPPVQHGMYANRTRVYPMAVSGPIRRFKWAIVAFCLTVYYGTPWLRWDRGAGAPDQAVLLDLAHRRFYVFGMEFWPQDIYFLTGLMVTGAIGLFMVTSLAGRVWCGFACPQTVWTDLFMMVERRIEGDRNKRMKRDAGPWTFDKIWRKTLKHWIWFWIAFWTGGAWIMYYVDAPTVTWEFWTGQASIEVYVFIGIFTFTTYTLAGWAREQVCTYMCPWPRFQAAMLDEQSLIVTYQSYRGEPRGHGGHLAREGLGDCIDCKACVNVCPVGIDIRDGLQLECISCGLCIDACNTVMRKTARTPWLVTFDTLASQAAKRMGRVAPRRLIRPRTYIYAAALLIVLSTMGIALATRASVHLIAMHDRAPLFVRLQNGSLRNGYAVKISNKTHQSAMFTLSVGGLENAGLTLASAGGEPRSSLALSVGGDTEGQFRVLLQGASTGLNSGSRPITFRVRNETTGDTATYGSVFLGPGAT